MRTSRENRKLTPFELFVIRFPERDVRSAPARTIPPYRFPETVLPVTLRSRDAPIETPVCPLELTTFAERTSSWIPSRSIPFARFENAVFPCTRTCVDDSRLIPALELPETEFAETTRLAAVDTWRPAQPFRVTAFASTTTFVAL